MTRKAPQHVGECSHPKWADAGTDFRGWTRVQCAGCRKFLGYRPPADVMARIYQEWKWRNGRLAGES